MKNNFSSFFKGLSTGVVIGMAIATTGTMMLGGKTTKKRLCRCARTVGDIMENVSYILK